MQQEIANSSPQTAHNFAGLFAALAAAKPPELPPWNDAELPQDVATLSYERALRLHARYKPEDPDCAGITRHPDGAGEVAQSETPERPQIRGQQKRPTADVPMIERDRKCASVTIRMSHAECVQLRERAAEAGLTISAYMRSCTFEAETLRAQVKEALMELRSRHAPETISTAIQASEDSSTLGSAHIHRQSSRLSWLRRIIPDLHLARNPLRA